MIYDYNEMIEEEVEMKPKDKAEIKNLLLELISHLSSKEKLLNTEFFKYDLHDEEKQFAEKIYNTLDEDEIKFVISIIENNLDYLIDVGMEFETLVPHSSEETKFILRQIKSILGWLILNPIKLIRLMSIAYKVL